MKNVTNIFSLVGRILMGIIAVLLICSSTAFSQPILLSATATSPTTIELEFNENVNQVNSDAITYAQITATGLDFTGASPTTGSGSSTITLHLDLAQSLSPDFTASNLVIAASLFNGDASAIDNVLINGAITDGIAPGFVSATAVSTTEIDIVFDEIVNYVVDEGTTLAGITSGSVDLSGSPTLSGEGTMTIRLTLDVAATAMSTNFSSTDLGLISGIFADASLSQNQNISYTGETITDGISPGFVSATAVSTTEIDIVFDEIVNYIVDEGTTLAGITSGSVDLSGSPTLSGEGTMTIRLTLDVSATAMSTNFSSTDFGLISGVFADASLSQNQNIPYTGETISDGIAPGYTVSPNTSNITSDGFDLNVTIDEPGDWYYVTVVDGSTAVTLNTDIQSGAGDVGATNSTGTFDESTTSVSISGLSVNTDYDIYVYAADAAFNENSFQKIDVFTNGIPVLAGIDTADDLIYSVGPNNSVSFFSGDETISDADNPAFISGASLTVSFSVNGETEDELLVFDGDDDTSGGVDVDGTNIEFEGTVVATYSGGNAGTDLVISFNASGTVASAQAILRLISYDNTQAAPVESTRTVSFVYNDGFVSSTASTVGITVGAIDTNSSIMGAANEETSKIDYTLFDGTVGSLDNNVTINVVQVYSFTITDVGGDGVDTTIDDIDLTVTSSAAALTDIKAIGLYDGTTLLAETGTIAASNTMSINSTTTENSTTTVDVWVSFNTTVTDNNQFTFGVSGFNQSGTTSEVGSFTTITSATGTDVNTIDVLASKLVVTSIDNPIGVGSGLTFNSSVEAQDVNNNIDTDFSETVTLSVGAGSVSGGNVSGTVANNSPTAGVYDWNDVYVSKAGTYNFDFISTSFTVMESGVDANSSTSDIIENTVFSYPQNIDYTAYQDTDITFGDDVNAIFVGQFDIRDDAGVAADGKVTSVTSMTIGLNSIAEADVARLALYRVSDNTELGEVAITGSTATYTFAFDVADGATETVALKATFNQATAITDGDILLFTVDAITDDNSPSKSGFADETPMVTQTSLTGNENMIDVVATQLVYSAGNPAGFQFERATGSLGFTIQAQDAIGNFDVDETSDLLLSGPTGLSATVISLSGGEVTPSITISNEFEDVTLTIADNDAGTGNADGNTLTSLSSINIDIYDTAPPTSSTIVPANSATGISLLDDLSIQFSEEVVGVSTKAITIYSPSPSFHSISIDADDTGYVNSDATGLVTISLPESLLPSRTYTVIIEDGAFSDAPNNTSVGGTSLSYVSIYEGTGWQFDTDVDDVAPTVIITKQSTITGDDTNGTSDTSVTFNIDWNEEIDDSTFEDRDDALLDALDDIVLGTTNITTGSTTLTNLGDDMTYTFQVDGIALVDPTASGSLNIIVGPNVTDIATNSMSGSVTSGDFVFDLTAPEIETLTFVSNNVTNTKYATIGNTITLDLKFSENLASDPIIAIKSGGAFVNSVIVVDDESDADETTWLVTVDVNALDTEGTFEYLMDFEDIAGNVVTGFTGTLEYSAAATTVVNTELIIDKSEPTVTSILRTAGVAEQSNANSTDVSFTVTFSEDVLGVDMNDFGLSGTASGTISVTSASATEYVVLVTVAADQTGELDLDFVGSPTITDNAGNSFDGTTIASEEIYTIDTTDPTVTSIVRTASANEFSNASSSVVSYTVTFSEDVLGVDMGDFTVSGTASGGVVTPVSGSGDTYTIDVTVGASQTGELDLDFVGSPTITDNAGNSFDVTMIASEETYTIDTTIPVISDITTEGATPSNLTSIEYRVVFDDAIETSSLTVADFTLVESGTNGTLVSGITEDVVGLEYLVSVTTNGVDGTLELTYTGSVNDAAGNTYSTLVLGGTNGTYTLDYNDPTVTSIVRTGGADEYSNANSSIVSYTVTFSEDVSGVDMNDFIVSGGVSNSIEPVTGSGTIYTIDVTVGANQNGSLDLDFVVLQDITDLSGNTLDGLIGSEQTYIIDTTTPAISDITAEDATPSNLTLIKYRVVFDDAIETTSLTVADFTLVELGTDGALVSGITEDVVGLEYLISVTTNGVDGTLELTYTGSVNDAAGNIYNTGFSSGTADTYTFDYNDPTVTSIVRTGVANEYSNASSSVVSYTVTFSEDVTGVTDDDFEISGSASGIVSGVSGSGDTYTILVTVGVNQTGLLDLDFAIDQDITDLSGGDLDESIITTKETYTIDTTPASIQTFTNPIEDPTNDATFDVTIVFTEDVYAALDASYFTVTNGTISAPVGTIPGTDFVLTVTPTDPSSDDDIDITLDANTGVLDIAGNESLGSSTYTVGYDGLVPVVIASNTVEGLDVTLTSQLNETGMLYWAVYTDGAGTPSAVDLIAGTGALYSGSVAHTIANNDILTEINLSAINTDYDLYLVAVDDLGNTGAVSSVIDIQTGGVIITPAIAVNDFCIDGDTQVLSDIIITEGIASDFRFSATSRTLKLELPADFEFNSLAAGDGVSITSGSDLSGVTLSYTTSNTLQIDYSVAGQNTIDELTITGLEVYAVGGTPFTGVTMTRTGGTGDIFNATESDNRVFATLTSKAAYAAPVYGVNAEPYLVENISDVANGEVVGDGVVVFLTAAANGAVVPFTVNNLAALDIVNVYSDEALATVPVTSTGVTTYSPTLAGLGLFATDLGFNNFYVTVTNGSNGCESEATRISIVILEATIDPNTTVFSEENDEGAILSVSLPSGHNGGFSGPGITGEDIGVSDINLAKVTFVPSFAGVTVPLTFEEHTVEYTLTKDGIDAFLNIDLRVNAFQAVLTDAAVSYCYYDGEQNWEEGATGVEINFPDLGSTQVFYDIEVYVLDSDDNRSGTDISSELMTKPTLTTAGLTSTSKLGWRFNPSLADIDTQDTLLLVTRVRNTGDNVVTDYVEQDLFIYSIDNLEIDNDIDTDAFDTYYCVDEDPFNIRIRMTSDIIDLDRVIGNGYTLTYAVNGTFGDTDDEITDFTADGTSLTNTFDPSDPNQDGDAIVGDETGLYRITYESPSISTANCTETITIDIEVLAKPAMPELTAGSLIDTDLINPNVAGAPAIGTADYLLEYSAGNNVIPVLTAEVVTGSEYNWYGDISLSSLLEGASSTIDGSGADGVIQNTNASQSEDVYFTSTTGIVDMVFDGCESDARGVVLEVYDVPNEPSLFDSEDQFIGSDTYIYEYCVTSGGTIDLDDIQLIDTYDVDEANESYFTILDAEKLVKTILSDSDGDDDPTDFTYDPGTLDSGTSDTLYIVQTNHDNSFNAGLSPFLGTSSDTTTVIYKVNITPEAPKISDFQEIETYDEGMTYEYRFCSGATLDELETPNLSGHDYIWSTSTDLADQVLTGVTDGGVATRTELNYSETTSLEIEYTYYVLNYTDANDDSGFIGCPSNDWTEVNITVYPQPVAPYNSAVNIGEETGSDAYTYCQDIDITSEFLSITSFSGSTVGSTQFKWYSSGPDVSSLIPFLETNATSIELQEIVNRTAADISVPAATTLYLTQKTDELCESPSLQVDITVNAIPTIEIVDSGQSILTTEFCYDEADHQYQAVLSSTDGLTVNDTMGSWNVNNGTDNIVSSDPIEGELFVSFDIDFWYNSEYGDGGLNGNGDTNSGISHTYELSYSYEDANGCSNSMIAGDGAVETITVHPLPTLDIEYDDDLYDNYSGSVVELDNFAVCYEEEQITLKGIADGVVTIGEWGLNSGDDALSATAGVSTVTLDLDASTTNAGDSEFGLSTDHIITYSHVDDNSCSKDVDINVTINPRPTLGITYDDGITTIDGTILCYDDVATIVGNQEGGEADALDGALVWSINSSGLSVNGDDSDRIDFTASLGATQKGSSELGAATDHEITFAFTDLLGCSSTVINTVTVNPLPNIGISMPNVETGPQSDAGEYCVSTEDVLLQGQIDGVDIVSGISSFTLSSGVSGIDDGGDGTATFNPNLAHFLTDDDGNIGIEEGGQPSNHTVFFTHEDGNGCFNTVEETLVVNPLPAIILTSTESNFSDVNFAVCESNSAFVIDAEFDGFQANNGMFFVNGTETDLVAGSLTKVAFDPELWGGVDATGQGVVSANHTVRYELDDVLGCSNTVEKVITIYNRPEMYFDIVGGCIDNVQYKGTVDDESGYVENELSYKWTWTSQTTGADEPLYNIEVDDEQDVEKFFELGNKITDSYDVSLEGTFTYTRASGVTDACVSLPYIDVSNILISPTVSFTWDPFVVGIESSFYPNELQLSVNSIDSIKMHFMAGADTVGYEVGTDITSNESTDEIGPINFTYTTPDKYSVSMTLVTDGDCESTIVREVNVLPLLEVTDEYLADFGGAFDPDKDGWYPESLTDDAALKSVVTLEDTGEEVDEGLREHSWVWSDVDFSNLTVATETGNISINVTDKPANSENNLMWATLGVSGENNYLQGEDSWVYSPVFNISGLDKPMVSMNILHDFENPKDGAIIQYSTDTLGQEWHVLGYTEEIDPETLELLTEGLDWYDSDNVGADPGQQQVLDNSLATSLGWSGRYEEDQSTWKTARHGLDVIPEEDRGFVRFRIAMAGTDDGDNKKGHFGYAFDDFVLRSRNKNVLIEEYYVVSDDEGAEKFNEGTEAINDAVENIVGNDDSQIILSYHVNLDNDITDPFNAVNTADPAARKSWYNLETVTSVLDGEVSSLADDDVLTWSSRDLRLNALEDPGFSIEVTADMSATNTEVLGTVSFEVNDVSGISAGTELIAYVAIIEETVVYEVGGIGSHTNVLRKLLPDASGQFIELNRDYDFGEVIPIGSATDPDGDENTLDIQWDIASILNADELAAVVFIQNRQTKEIYQTIKIEASTANSIVASKSDAFEDILNLNKLVNDTDFDMYPNPTDGSVTIRFNKDMTESLDWTLYDQTGRVFDYGSMNPGRDRFVIETDGFPSGLYYMQIKGDQFKLEHKKLMILH